MKAGLLGFARLYWAVVWLVLVFAGCDVDDRSLGVGGPGDASTGRGPQSSGTEAGARPDVSSSSGDASRGVSMTGDTAGSAPDASMGSDVGSVDPTGDPDGGDTVAPAAPALSIDPATKDFNTVVTGLFAEAAFQVSNTGEQPTSVPAVDLDGTDAASFSISSNTCTAAIAPGDDCIVTVRFSPAAAGPKGARLNVRATLGGAASASLQGLGVAPGALTIAPPTLAFGSVLQGAQTSPSTFTVSNTGGTPTGMLATSIGGSTEFAKGTDGCSGRSLAAAATCTIQVTFAPTSSGQKSGSLLVSGTPGGTASSGLTGVGLAPATLAISPTTANFASTTVRASSAGVTFTVTNRGGAAAGTTTALASALGGTSATEFAVSSSTCTGMLAAGASCTLVVVFRPTATGARAGTLTVSATPGATASATLAGTGLSAASLALTAASGSSANFGTVVVGTPEVDTFVVTNPGQQASSALTITVSGTGFSLSTPGAGDCVSGTTVLAPAATCTVHVSLAPAAAGTPTGTLSVSATTGGSAMLALSATAVPPGALTVSPTAPSFTSLLPGALGTPVTFTISNTGGAATGALSASITRSTEFAITTDNCSTHTLAAAATCTISVRFAPTSAGQKNGSLAVTATPGGTASVSLLANGLAPASLALSATSATYADTVAGTTSAAQSFTVTNIGDVAAGTTTALAAVLSGPNAAEFTISSNSCMTTLAAHATCAVSVAFRPTSAGTGKAATLTVSATPGAVPTLSLRGNGLAPAALHLAAASGSTTEFGALVVATTSQPQTYVVSNSGQQTSSPLTIALTAGRGFAVVTPPTGTDCISLPATNATTLAPSATCTVRVRFTPPAAVAEMATLSASATTGGSSTLTLTGTGRAASQLAVTPSSVSFGSVLQGGHSASTSVVVTNTGGVAAGALTTSLPGGEFGATDGCRGVALGANESCTIAVTFNPTSGTGTANGTATITGSPGGSLTVTLSGTRAALTLTPSPVPAFPSTAVNTASASRSVTVTNPVTGSTGNLSVTKTGTNPGDFVVSAGTCTGMLGSRGFCTVTVSFQPLALGSRSATLSVSATPGGTVTTGLSGTGTGCGNNVVETGEACDDGNVVSGDGCSATCKHEVISLAIGNNHTCALISGGTVKCWGDNSSGQLGIGSTTSKGGAPGQMGDNLPAVNLGRAATAIGVGALHTCAVLDDGTLKCWGSNGLTETGINAGEGTVLAPAGVVPLPPGSRVTAVSGGNSFTCALLSSGNVYCWGDFGDGKLGRPPVADPNNPIGLFAPGRVAMPASCTPTSLTVDGEVGCTTCTNGTLECWGYNGEGAVGSGDLVSSRDAPVSVVHLLGAPKAVAEGRDHTCALFTTNAVECWGNNGFGQLGIGMADNNPHPMDVATPLVALGMGAKVVAPSSSHTCALLVDNSVKCWGDNEFGQLGLGDTVARPQPATAPINLGAGRSAKFVTFGNGDHVCVILDDGTVKCWGRNDQGQLGLGDTANRGGSGTVASLPIIDVAGSR